MPAGVQTIWELAMLATCAPARAQEGTTVSLTLRLLCNFISVLGSHHMLLSVIQRRYAQLYSIWYKLTILSPS